MKPYLQYVGKGRIIIDIHKKGKREGTRKRVPTSLQSMVKRPFDFENGDILDERAVAYYKELESLNVHLCEFTKDSINNNLEESNNYTENLVTEEPIEESTETETTEEIQEQPIGEISEEVADDIEETIEKEVVENDQEEIVDNNVVIQPIEESDRAEMIAYLDATYDKDGLKNLAKEFGVEFNSRISSEKLIEKLIDEKYPQILEMMK